MASFKRWLVGSPIKTARLAHERLTKKLRWRFRVGRALLYSLRDRTNPARVGRCVHGGTARCFWRGYSYLDRDQSTADRCLTELSPDDSRLSVGRWRVHCCERNLGTIPGLIAGASLLVDYILTVSVSVAAGVEAITSAMVGTRFAELHDHRVAICLFFLIFVTLANLRGVREAGSMFAAPSYAFIVSFLFLIGYGLVRYSLIRGSLQCRLTLT